MSNDETFIGNRPSIPQITIVITPEKAVISTKKDWSSLAENHQIIQRGIFFSSRLAGAVKKALKKIELPKRINELT